MIYEVGIGEKIYHVDLIREGEGWSCKLDGRPVPINVVATQAGILSILIDGKLQQRKTTLCSATSDLLPW